MPGVLNLFPSVKLIDNFDESFSFIVFTLEIKLYGVEIDIF
jgi:hypothetical protein